LRLGELQSVPMRTGGTRPRHWITLECVGSVSGSRESLRHRSSPVQCDRNHSSAKESSPRALSNGWPLRWIPHGAANKAEHTQPVRRSPAHHPPAADVAARATGHAGSYNLSTIRDWIDKKGLKSDVHPDSGRHRIRWGDLKNISRQLGLVSNCDGSLATEWGAEAVVGGAPGTRDLPSRDIGYIASARRFQVQARTSRCGTDSTTR
jgi:hypothetical protein